MKSYSFLIFAAAFFGLLLASGCGANQTAASKKSDGNQEIDKDKTAEIKEKDMEKQAGGQIVNGHDAHITAATKKLVGKWEIDKDKYREAILKRWEKKEGDREIGEAQKNLAELTMKQIAESTESTLDFTSYGAFVFMWEDPDKSTIGNNTFDVVNANGNELILHLKYRGVKNNVLKVIFIDDDTITTNAKSMEAIEFSDLIYTYIRVK